MNEIAFKKAIIGTVLLWMRTCNNKIDLYLLWVLSFFQFRNIYAFLRHYSGRYCVGGKVALSQTIRLAAA